MDAFDWILLGAVAFGLIPVAVFALESLAAVWPSRPSSVEMTGPRPRCAILMPAHNEETGIANSIASLQSELLPGDRIIVIADNCSDATANVARQFGIEAIERNDPERRGKGYALAFGLNSLEADPPDVVVVIDADTRALPGSVAPLIATAFRLKRPAQGVFTDSPKVRGPREQWSAFALTFKNLVRPLGLYRLGLPCLLTGSGMAFPWAVIRGAELGTGNIVEDMQLGIDLALAGYPSSFCAAARFESDDAPNAMAASKRRTRWEHGHVFTMLTQVPRLFWAGLIQLRPKLWGMALELSVPPLSLLFLCEGFLLAVCAVWWIYGGSFVPALALAIGAAVGIAAILTIWSRFGRALISPKILCLLPVYVLWKVPIYLKLMVAPQRTWVRTERTPTP